MNTDRGREGIERIRAKHHLPPDAKVGIVTSFSKTEMLEDDGRTLRQVATTDDIDLQEEVVVPAGADTSYFLKNGKLFADHNYSIPDAIGHLRAPGLTNFIRGDSGQAGWEVRSFMYSHRLVKDIADAVLAMALSPGGVGVSIGFQALDYGPPTTEELHTYCMGKSAPSSIVRRWKWLELSYTCFPCNVACQTLSVQENTRVKSSVDNLLTTGKITRKAAIALGFKEAERRVVVVK